MIDYKIEYETLREELDLNKRYVFERPILIVTVSLAAINFGTDIWVPYIPAFITALLCFNLSFTVNRLFSSARIIAYISLVVERNHKPYIGWENTLQLHRELASMLGSKRIDKIIKDELVEEAVPRKGYGFYPVIYFFHVFILVVTYASLFVNKYEPSIGMIIISGISTTYFVFLLFRYSTKRLRKNLLYERALMEKVLLFQQDRKIIAKLIKKYPD